MKLEPSLQALVNNGTLRHISSEGGIHEYVIDSLKHVQQTGFGPQTITYSLIIDEDAEDGRYEINDGSDYQGGDNLLSTNDAEEVVAWINDQISAGA